ncbi:MAG: TRAP transporter small permease [Gemmobacter sp.]
MLTRLEAATGSAVRGLAFLGGLAILLAMGLLTVVDIVLRRMGLGIPGGWEMVTFAMRWMIGLSLPLAFHAGRHVAVEAFTDLMPERLRLGFVLLAELASLLAMGLLTWRLWIRGLDILNRGTLTTDLQILTFWHWLPLIGGSALSVAVLVVLILRDGRALVARRAGSAA